MRRAAAFRLLSLLALAIAWAPHLGFAEERVPEEYKTEEFPAWALKLRRAEIVAVGSLPFSLFVVTFSSDSIRYFLHAGEDTAAQYAPWPFRTSSRAAYTTGEAIAVGVGVLVCSAAVALADYLIGEMRERRAAAP
jgi:hypothetical protein